MRLADKFPRGWHSSETRAREVGLAFMDLDMVGTLRMCVVANNHSYAETMSMMDVLDATEIVVCESRMQSPLARRLVEEYGEHACHRLATWSRH